ncbi:class I SAM-dependent methyltransferase [uncultured Eudoraea sp.]|uniref:class I SAM-dependent methyltransferase n=1 Tax=uncultured Eudoraea sp. TaxID=1035614 RepID=UPI002622C336|nr:class I SAM-dependent methyltransferase [uncultured Eudoraea sp.]
MNKEILRTGVQDYINNNLNTDIMSVLLQKSNFDAISSKELAQQIEGKKKCAVKLPTWFGAAEIYYPSKLNIEQSSSENTALYKASLLSGNSLLDLTGGFGVDGYFFSQKIPQVILCEISRELSEITAHNLNILRANNIKILNVDGIEYLKKSDQSYDWIYIDPSRRDKTKGKVFKLSDCSPDITEHLDLLKKKSKAILLKTSPLLDITMGLTELKNVEEIHVVAVNNDVKELLWIIKDNNLPDPLIKTINIKNTQDEAFEYKRSNENSTKSEFSKPLDFLYEPNAAILKAGAFKTLGNKFHLKKLHEHTHLYTSVKEVNFPGRVFRILSTHPYSKKSIAALNIEKANITIRNFPITVADIRKKYKITDGGELYLFFVKDLNNKLLILKCSKI